MCELNAFSSYNQQCTAVILSFSLFKHYTTPRKFSLEQFSLNRWQVVICVKDMFVLTFVWWEHCTAMSHMHLRTELVNECSNYDCTFRKQKRCGHTWNGRVITSMKLCTVLRWPQYLIFYPTNSHIWYWFQSLHFYMTTFSCSTSSF